MAIFSQRQGGTAALPTGVGYYPSEGSRVMSATYSWLGNNREYSEDLSDLLAEGKLSTIQSVWVDNSLCAMPIIIRIAGTNQNIFVPGMTQAIFPCYFTGGPRFIILGIPSNNEGGVPLGFNDNYTNISFLNVPQSPFSINFAPGIGSLTGTQILKINVADGAAFAILYPGDQFNRMYIQSINLFLEFPVGNTPTTAGNSTVVVWDTNAAYIIASARVSFGVGDTTVKSVAFPSLGYLTRGLPEQVAIQVNGFPAGASNITINGYLTFSLIPVAY